MLLPIASLLVPTPPQWLNYQWTIMCNCFLPDPLPRDVWVCENSGKSVWLMSKDREAVGKKCLKPEGPCSPQSPTEVPGRCRWLSRGLWDAVCRKFSLVLFGNKAFALTLIPAYKIGTEDMLVQMGQVIFPPPNGSGQRDNVPWSCHKKFYLFQLFTNSEANSLWFCQEVKLADFTEICEPVADDKKCWSHGEKSLTSKTWIEPATCKVRRVQEGTELCQTFCKSLSPV